MLTQNEPPYVQGYPKVQRQVDLLNKGLHRAASVAMTMGGGRFETLIVKVTCNSRAKMKQAGMSVRFSIELVGETCCRKMNGRTAAVNITFSLGANTLCKYKCILNTAY